MLLSVSPEYTWSRVNTNLRNLAPCAGGSLYLKEDPFIRILPDKLYEAAGCLHRLQRKFRLPFPAGKVQEAVKDTSGEGHLKLWIKPF